MQGKVLWRGNERTTLAFFSLAWERGFICDAEGGAKDSAAWIKPLLISTSNHRRVYSILLEDDSGLVLLPRSLYAHHSLLLLRRSMNELPFSLSLSFTHSFPPFSSCWEDVVLIQRFIHFDLLSFPILLFLACTSCHPASSSSIKPIKQRREEFLGISFAFGRIHCIPIFRKSKCADLCSGRTETWDEGKRPRTYSRSERQTKERSKTSRETIIDILCFWRKLLLFPRRQGWNQGWKTCNRSIGREKKEK